MLSNDPAARFLWPLQSHGAQLLPIGTAVAVCCKGYLRAKSNTLGRVVGRFGLGHV